MGDRLMDAIVSDLDSMSEADLRAEFAEDGLDFDAETERLRRMMLRACGPPPPPPLRELLPPSPWPSPPLAFIIALASCLAMAAWLAVSL